jgi:hypothetical protein
MKIYEKIKLKNEREIKLFDIPLLQYEKVRNGEKNYFKVFPSKSFKSRFFDSLIESFPSNDGFYIVKQALGESYLLTSFIHALSKKHNVKNPVIIGERKYHLNLFKIFLPDIKCSYNQGLSDNLRLVSSKIVHKYKNVLFFIYITKGFFDIFYKIGDNKKDAHYFNEVIEHYSLQMTDAVRPKPAISKQKIESCMSKVKEINLNKDKFVFFMPEANTCSEWSLICWEKLASGFIERGYDIFVNTLNGRNPMTYGKSCYLDLEEAYALASISKGVIGLRSGFLETLSSLKDLLLHIIYTRFAARRVPLDKVLSMNSVKTFPWADVSNIYEYDSEKIPEETIIKQILSMF